MHWTVGYLGLALFAGWIWWTWPRKDRRARVRR